MKLPRKIKILRIIARLNIGGPAIHTILLTSALNNSKFETLLACGVLSPGEGDMSYYAQEKGVTFEIIPSLKRELNLFSDFSALKQIYSLIVKENPDIIHTHTAKAGSLGRLAGIVYNFFPGHKKVIIIHTFHGHVLSGYFSGVISVLFKFIERFLASFTDQIITVSESVKNDLIKLGIAVEKKIRVIPLGFELNKFLELPVVINNDKFNVGIIGRLVAIKNHRLFIDAVSKISHSSCNLDISFKIIGDGEERQELDDYAKGSGIKQIEFLGWKKDLASIYSKLDLVVLTSLNEGTPVSLIEAMASAKAVVSTDVGGVSDLMGEELKAYSDKQDKFRVFERGILVKSGDSDGLASAIIFISADGQLRKAMGMSGRMYVQGAFSKERLIKDIEDLYSNLAVK